MSRNPYDGYVLNVVRMYPRLCDKLAEKRTAAMSITASGGGGASSTPGKPTERAALVTLSEKEQRWLDAVEAAIRETRQLPDGVDRLKIIDLLFWCRTRTMYGVALEMHMSYRTVRRRRTAFLRLVGKNLGL